MENSSISKLGLIGIVVMLLGFNGTCQNQSDTAYSDTHKEFLDGALYLKYTSGIRSILEDSKGNIWFGSHQEGVCLYDGENFTYFTKADGLSDNQIRSIYEDSSGKIWFEGGEELSYFKGQKITLQSEKVYSSKTSWRSSKNDLWFKSDGMIGYNVLEGHPGVYRYDGNILNYHIFPITLEEDEENYYSVSTPFIKGDNGMFWFGTYGAAIGYDGTSFNIIDDKRLGLNDKTGHLHIRSIFEDSKGNLWIGNNGIGVFKYDGQTIINFTEQESPNLEDTKGNSLDRIFSIGEDNLGNIWIGTIESGVWQYDGNTLTNFTEKDGLESNHIWTIYRTKVGEIWFGGANPSGVYKFNGSSFQRIY